MLDLQVNLLIFYMLFVYFNNLDLFLLLNDIEYVIQDNLHIVIIDIILYFNLLFLHLLQKFMIISFGCF